LNGSPIAYHSNKLPIGDPENPVISYPYTVTTEKFEGNIQGPTRGAEKQKTVKGTWAILNDLRIQQKVTKQAPTWIFESAFDATQNPYLHESIFYFFLTTIWFERK
jgi:hypothetical protein